MKDKLSVTLDRALVQYLDRLPGSSRSAKLERILRNFRKMAEDMQLRRALAKVREDAAERSEREAWTRTMEQDQWRQFEEVISGRSN